MCKVLGSFMCLAFRERCLSMLNVVALIVASNVVCTSKLENLKSWIK
jgi:hypothetical protein